MAGLLNMFDGEEGLLGALALMSAGSAKPVRTSLADGLLGSVQVMQQAKTAREDREMKKQQFGLQQQQQQIALQQLQQQIAQQQAAAQRNAEFQRALQGGAVTPQQALAGGGGPTQANAAQIGQQRPANFAELALKYPEQAKLIESLAGAQDWGRAEVARTEETMQDGRPVKQQFDKFGRAVGGALPQWKAPVQADTGGAVNFIDPVTLAKLGMLGKTNTPGELLSAQTAMRGQNMTDARSREKNQIDRDAVGKVDWKQDVNGNWIGLPKEVSGQGPVNPVSVNGPGKREQQARNAIDILDAATPLIEKGTSSYLGAGVDMAARAFGKSFESGDAAAQLKSLEGALMMAQPRMEGPQSNMDVQLYRQMAGAIGDPTVPVSQKQAASQVIRQLHSKYAGGGSSPAPAGGQPRRITGDADYNSLPSGAQFVGPDGVLRRKP